MKKLLLLFYVCDFLPTYMFVYNVCVLLWRKDKGVRSSGTGVTGNSELSFSL